MAEFPAPKDGILITHFITSSDVARSRDFYVNVMGGEIAYDGPVAVVQLANTWVIIGTAGEPTEDKPGIKLAVPTDLNQVSAFMNVRVADIQKIYKKWTERGAEFLAPPIDRGPEIRAYVRDPDGYLIEVGQINA